MICKGIDIYDSGNPGVSIGILMSTHGNEIVGKVTYKKLLESGLLKSIKAGVIYFIEVNIEAAKHNKRFIDINMNRIGKNLHKTGSYEYKRFNEILPILNKCDVVLDLHSVSKKINSFMGICHSRDAELANKVLRTDRLLIDDNFDNEGSLISFVTKRGGIGFGIECGYHEQDDARKNALDNIISLLRHYEMITGEYKYQSKNQLKGTYKFMNEVFPISKNFSFTRSYNNFDPINPGETFATDCKKKYINESNHELYLGIIGKKVTVGDGIAFLFEKVY